MQDQKQALLEISSLSIRFGEKAVVRNLSLRVGRGEAVGVIGESGSGKSMTSLAILGLLPGQAAVSGSIRYAGLDLTAMNDRTLRSLRGCRIAMVFQDAMSALNPLMTVGAQIVEAIRAHRPGVTLDQARADAVSLLAEVGLPEPVRQLGRYSFEMSGGQQQRAMIAMALAGEPDLLIADEPTTALDISTQVQVLQLLQRIRRSRGMALLFVSHDLEAVAAMADQVAVMRHGELVEFGPVAEVMQRPAHSYTRSLLEARPRRAQPVTEAVRRGPWAVELDRVCIAYGAQRVVHEVSLQVAPGEALGIVGESGSGKSTIARAIMGMLPVASGVVQVMGRDPGDRRHRLDFARQCQFVFQDTSGSLNPRRTIGQALAEPQQIHGIGRPADILRRNADLLQEVGLDPVLLNRYPHQLSGGQRQRVVIARALATNPQLLVCDEPVSALDATVRAQVLELIHRLRVERKLTLVFIGHDLAVMQSVAERTLVLQKGRVVESGATHQVFSTPSHAYTQALIAAGNWAREAAIAAVPNEVLAAAA